MNRNHYLVISHHPQICNKVKNNFDNKNKLYEFCIGVSGTNIRKRHEKRIICIKVSKMRNQFRNSIVGISHGPGRSKRLLIVKQGNRKEVFVGRERETEGIW